MYGEMKKLIGVASTVLACSVMVLAEPPEAVQKSVAGDLLPSCAVIRYGNEHAGSGFFVEVRGRGTNTWLVTAKHVFEKVGKRMALDNLSVSVEVLPSETATSVEFELEEFTVERVFQFDMAAVSIKPELLKLPGTNVRPLVYRIGGDKVTGEGGKSGYEIQRDLWQSKMVDMEVFLLVSSAATGRGGVARGFPVDCKWSRVVENSRRWGNLLELDYQPEPGNSGAPVFVMTDAGPRFLGVAVAGHTLKEVDEGGRDLRNETHTLVAPGKYLTAWFERWEREKVIGTMPDGISNR